LHSQTTHSRWRNRLLAVAVTAGGLLALSGCTAQEKRGFLPGYEDGGPVTDQTDRTTHLWVGSWTAALIIGVAVWGLIIWCMVVYRRRKGDNVLPVQTRYHMPLEIMYTAVPLILIGALFFFTARDQAVLRDVSGTPDVTIQVLAKQWSWDFNYVDEDVYESGVQVNDVGELHQSLIDPSTGKAEPGTDEALPTLVLPAGKKVLFDLQSRDVIHSFWVPAFLDKMDIIPGHPNQWEVTPLREGVYAGKCAELCGEHHSGMLFNVKIVSPEEYDTYIQSLRDKGQEGQLGVDLNRSQDGGTATAASSEGEN